MSSACPRCTDVVLAHPAPGTHAARCPQCGGHLVPVDTLRTELGADSFAVVWDALQDRAFPSDTPCPRCSSAMQAVQLPVDSLFGTVEVDFCGPCAVVWFDAREREQLAAGPSTDRLEHDQDTLSKEVEALFGADRLPGLVAAPTIDDLEGETVDLDALPRPQPELTSRPPAAAPQPAPLSPLARWWRTLMGR